MAGLKIVFNSYIKLIFFRNSEVRLIKFFATYQDQIPKLFVLVLSVQGVLPNEYAYLGVPPMFCAEAREAVEPVGLDLLCCRSSASTSRAGLFPAQMVIVTKTKTKPLKLLYITKGLHRSWCFHRMVAHLGLRTHYLRWFPAQIMLFQ